MRVKGAIQHYRYGTLL